ncbi:MAG: ACP S-malonyltransferase [Alphaproteobacteria bacterium]|nr:ACP S-malonyltransferase [Alphaproteobacteria bacterium]
MTIAFIFPGQGSQSVGMGKKLAADFSVARDVFAEIDEALGQNLSQLMFEGPQEELDLTSNTQPAIMAVSMAVLRVMESLGLDIKRHVKFVAGHSLGEYSALCAAGMFSLSDTAKLLRIRGQAMQQAVPAGKGAMAAIIGCEENELAMICDKAATEGQVCQIANDNGGGQLVISGSADAVAAAVNLAKEELRAKKAVFLAVSAPFHCALMHNAALTMEKALANVVKSEPKIELIPNISVSPQKDLDIIVDLLVQQVTGRVRWRETIEWFAANGVNSLYEIGWGQILTKLTKRIDKNLSAYSVYEAEAIETSLKALNL